MDLCNINDIKALLGRHGFHFSKSMGQNFLIEAWVPTQIAEASGADSGIGVMELQVAADATMESLVLAILRLFSPCRDDMK